MHLRGKAMQVTALFPNGQQQVISRISNFDFNWMTTYPVPDDDGAAAAQAVEGHRVARQRIGEEQP
ncbi:MAG: hypothetical protein U0Q11_22985 [Vicinamibacterales bacterium]